MIKRVVKCFISLLLIYFIICSLTPNLKFLRNRSIENQINYLSKILDEGYDDRLQNIYPEGKIFSNALLALSIIEYSEKNSTHNERYALIVDRCIQRMQSKKALSIFSKEMEPEFGMFYNGWSYYVNSSFLESSIFDFSLKQEIVFSELKRIESDIFTLQKDSVRIMPSYYDACWPADNLIGIIALKDTTLKKVWIQKLLESSTSKSNLIPHASSNTNEIRGSSTAMITLALNKSGYNKSEAYNEKFENLLIDSYLGIQLVKENKDGSDDYDIDSGPVLFGYGAAATVMNIKTQASFEKRRAKCTWAIMNFISLPINVFNQKYYLFKKEPMFDLFMLWASVELDF